MFDTFKLALGASALAFALPATAAQTVLTFDRGETACTTTAGGPTGVACTADRQFIGANYGSSAGLTVSYDAMENNGSNVSLRHTSGYFFTSNDGQAYALFPGDELSRITLTPTAGYEVSFVSFAWDKLTATTSADFFFELRDANNSLLFSADNSVLSYTWNSAYSSGPLTFLFGNGGRGAVAVDNIAFDVRQIATGAVPEPATWAMLILGFGVVGGSLRRRSVLQRQTKARLTFA